MDVLAFSPYGQDADNSDKESDSQSDETRSMLHSFGLYILAAEILGYLRDGAGDEGNLAGKYSHHPGWIPAFSKSTYDADEDALYVPLGQFVWKIKTGREGEMQFGLLDPKDRDLEDADKKMLVHHLFGVIQEADMRHDKEKAIQMAELADGLLYPGQRKPSSPRGKTGNALFKPRSDFDHSL